MSRFSRAVLIFAALAATLSIAGIAQGKDPLIGTWSLNVEKSTFKGAPGPKGQLRTYARSDGLEKMTARGVSAERKPTLVRYEARYDGMDYDITGSSGGDKISLRRIDALTTESTQKRDGKPAIVATRQVSADGKTLTVVTKGTLSDGRGIDSTLIFEKR
jgi:hypothetical protein